MEPLRAGQLVGPGRFVLIKELGRGGMGVVWLAQDNNLAEQVALKFLPTEIAADPVALNDLRRETVRSHRLTHPNIIRIHDFHEQADGGAFISMEYVEGQTLSGWRLRQLRQVFSWEQLAPFARQLCAALEYAHGEGVIHRDLKPANVMLDNRGRVKLADFGIAAVVSDSASRVSDRSSSGGTLAYMSPQQLEGHKPAVGDDLYALGATFYELLTGRPPFHSGDITHQVLRLAPTPIKERLLDLGVDNPVPEEVSALIMACLAKQPEQRPQSAQAVARLLDGQSPSVAEISRAGDPEKRRSPVPWLFALGLCGLGAWYYLKQPGNNATVTSGSASSTRQTEGKAGAAPKVEAPAAVNPSVASPPSPSMADTEALELVLDANFEDAAPGFAAGSTKTVRSTWEDSHYLLAALGGGTWWPSQPKIQSLNLRDFVCEIEAQIPNRAAGSWGLGLVRNSEPRHPWIGVNNNSSGQVEIYSYDEKPLVKWMDFPAMPVVGSWNRFRVEARGPHVRLSINDHFVAEAYQAGRLTPVALTLYLQTPRAGFEVWFRRVRVWQLKSSEGQNRSSSHSANRP